MLKNYAEIIITPRELQSCSVLNKKIVISRSKNVLIEGQVFDQNLKHIKDAIIIIKSIDCNYNPFREKNVGYVVTNCYGKYAIYLKKRKNVFYKFDIYEPIIN